MPHSGSTILPLQASPGYWRGVTLHLREDTPLDPAKVMAKVAMKNSPWKLTPDMKLTRRFPAELAGEALDRVETLVRELAELRKTG